MLALMHIGGGIRHLTMASLRLMTRVGQVCTGYMKSLFTFPYANLQCASGQSM
jgi:hypothetical protein